MIITMNPGITAESPETITVCEKARRHGLNPVPDAEVGAHYNALQIFLKDGEKVRARSVRADIFENMDGVAQVVRVSPAMVSLSGNGNHEPRRVMIGDTPIGLGLPCLPVIGTCTIDLHTATLVERLAALGVQHTRGGFRKPRSSAEGYRGPGERGLEIFMTAARDCGMKSIWTEVIESGDLDIIRRVRDRVGFTGAIVLWVGARNIGNFLLLEALGMQNEFVVMLKHGLKMTELDEFFRAAEFVVHGRMEWNIDGTLNEEASREPGTHELILCVRGQHKHDRYSPLRFYPNYGWISALHKQSWAPVCFDPSHIGGRVDLVFKVLEEGLEYHPDCVLVEAHLDPTKALCDADQAIPIERVPEILAMVQAHNSQPHQ